MRAMVSRGYLVVITFALEVISPIATMPVVAMVSYATRAMGSCADARPKSASGVWSQTLSG